MIAGLARMPVAVASRQPDDTSVEQWATWFWNAFLPGWIDRASDREAGGFFDSLDKDGLPDPAAPKTVLAQSRLLFTFAHLALLTGDPLHHDAAKRAYDFLSHFRGRSGLYARAVARDGQATGEDADAVARSYDQSFVILALATWERLAPDDTIKRELDACWDAIQAILTDPNTGLLLEDDTIKIPSAPEAPPRAQNPHMHLYEAALQAFEMTGEPLWLDRAATVRQIALDHFLDRDSGTIIEFLAPDLSFLSGKEGIRREVGHQCEWAWLLDREARLGGSNEVRAIAQELTAFADAHGFATSGLMSGAALDAVSADAAWRCETFLLWPQTEAIKSDTARFLAGDEQSGKRARSRVKLMFDRYFDGRAAFANQLDRGGAVLWPDAMSRLVYHLVLALTEGAGAGLWPGPTRYKNGGVQPCSI